jgi:glycosyltransferase involved in cell wall biosynthesis
MKVAIGILAHNEEGFVGATVASLLAQTLVADPQIQKEIVVVANGCSDRTAETARQALNAIGAGWNATGEVLDLETPGKANAWNVFVHETIAPDTDYIVLLDADIEFAAPDAIERLINHLDANPAVAIAPDQPVKKFSDGGGVLRPVIRALQKTGSDDDHALSGQLYAARASDLLSVVMPVGIVVEDGFLRAMTLTRNFSAAETLPRILRAPGVRHFYAPYETFAAIYRYERRQAVGTTINRYLYDEFRRLGLKGADLANAIEKRNSDDPAWIEKIIAARISEAGLVAVPKNYALRRLRRRENWSLKNIVKAPLIAASVLFDLVVALDATRQLKDRSKGAHWDAIRSS